MESQVENKNVAEEKYLVYVQKNQFSLKSIIKLEKGSIALYWLTNDVNFLSIKGFKN